MTKPDEKVLCVSRHTVDTMLSVPGDPESRLAFLLASKTYRWRSSPNDDGPPVEEDDTYKQLIPYIVVVNSSDQILAHNRGKGGGEEKLRNKWSIGFGGHINDQDADWMAGIKRELREELDVKQPISIEKQFGGEIDWAYFSGPIGFINDDSNDVGRKHLGVVYVLRADEVTPREVREFAWADTTLLELWAKNGHISMDGAELESWSVLALPMVREFLKGGA